jgi:hypothetical protein
LIELKDSLFEGLISGYNSTKKNNILTEYWGLLSCKSNFRGILFSFKIENRVSIFKKSLLIYELWIDRNELWMDGSKLWMDRSKLWMDRSELWADRSELWADRNELWMDRSKLWMDGNELWMDGSKLWMDGNGLWGDFGVEMGCWV